MGVILYSVPALDPYSTLPPYSILLLGLPVSFAIPLGRDSHRLHYPPFVLYASLVIRSSSSSPVWNGSEAGLA